LRFDFDYPSQVNAQRLENSIKNDLKKGEDGVGSRPRKRTMRCNASCEIGKNVDEEARMHFVYVRIRNRVAGVKIGAAELVNIRAN
jgi:hypothetical protein